MTGQQLKNSILQMAVQGKLVPQDPNDEPASVLLERIRKEKEQLIKEGKIKKGKKPPVGAIPCCDPDPVTGHHPHWVKVDSNNPSDRWFCEAFNNTFHNAFENGELPIKDGTYEAIGPHFNGNKHNLGSDILVKHGTNILDVPRTFEGIKQYLAEHRIEGIVFWLDGEPMCKIKRSDFGFDW